jgi:hypothetical protein
MTLSKLAHWAGAPTGLRIGAGFEKVSAPSAAEDAAPHPETFVHVASEGAYGQAEGNDDLRRPGERLSVFGYDRWGENRLRGEIVVTTPSLSREAAALSMMAVPPERCVRDGRDWDRRNRHDIRGLLLLAMIAEDRGAIEKCYRHGVRYLAAWAASRRLEYRPEIMDAAAADALVRFYFRRDKKGKAWPLHRRAKSLQMSASEFGDLRRVCLNMYRARFLEGVVAFGRQNR